MPPAGLPFFFSLLLAFWCFLFFSFFPSPFPNNDPICWPRAARWAGGTSARREGQSKAPQTHLAQPPPVRGAPTPQRVPRAHGWAWQLPELPPRNPRASSARQVHSARFFFLLFYFSFFFYFSPKHYLWRSVRSRVASESWEAPSRVPAFEAARQEGRDLRASGRSWPRGACFLPKELVGRGGGTKNSRAGKTGGPRGVARRIAEPPGSGEGGASTGRGKGMGRTHVEGRGHAWGTRGHQSWSRSPRRSRGAACPGARAGSSTQGCGEVWGSPGSAGALGKITQSLARLGQPRRRVVLGQTPAGIAYSAYSFRNEPSSR